MHISIFVIIINSKLEKSERQSMVINAKYHWPGPGYGIHWRYKKRKTWVLQLCKFQRNLDLETKSNFSKLNNGICLQWGVCLFHPYQIIVILLDFRLNPLNEGKSKLLRSSSTVYFYHQSATQMGDFVDMTWKIGTTVVQWSRWKDSYCFSKDLAARSLSKWI